eukprot:7390894-Prymnesium_polylepis.1
MPSRSGLGSRSTPRDRADRDCRAAAQASPGPRETVVARRGGGAVRQRTRRRAAANGCGRWGAAGSSGGAVSRSRRWRPRGKVARRPWRASLATTRLLRAQQATLIRTSEEGRLRPPSFPARGRGATPAASLFCCRVVTAARPCSRQPDPTRLLSSTSCDSIQSQSCRRRYSTLRESIRLWAEERGRKGDVRALGHRVARPGRSTEGVGDREAVSGYTDTKSQSGINRSVSETLTLYEIRLTTHPCADPPRAREWTRTHLLEALTAKTPPSEHVGSRGSAAEASPGHLFPPSRP